MFPYYPPIAVQVNNEGKGFFLGSTGGNMCKKIPCYESERKKGKLTCFVS